MFNLCKTPPLTVSTWRFTRFLLKLTSCWQVGQVRGCPGWRCSFSPTRTSVWASCAEKPWTWVRQHSRLQIPTARSLSWWSTRPDLVFWYVFSFTIVIHVLNRTVWNKPQNCCCVWPCLRTHLLHHLTSNPASICTSFLVFVIKEKLADLLLPYSACLGPTSCAKNIQISKVKEIKVIWSI